MDKYFFMLRRSWVSHLKHFIIISVVLGNNSAMDPTTTIIIFTTMNAFNGGELVRFCNYM